MPVEAPKVPRQFTQEEKRELIELHRIAKQYNFMAVQIKGNTALIPEGQKVAQTFEALARLAANVQAHWVSGKLAECGYSPEVKVEIDLETGVITPTAAPVPSPKAMQPKKSRPKKK